MHHLLRIRKLLMMLLLLLLLLMVLKLLDLLLVHVLLLADLLLLKLLLKGLVLLGLLEGLSGKMRGEGQVSISILSSQRVQPVDRTCRRGVLHPSHQLALSSVVDPSSSSLLLEIEGGAGAGGVERRLVVWLVHWFHVVSEKLVQKVVFVAGWSRKVAFKGIVLLKTVVEGEH